MAEKMVKVTIAKGVEVHYHKGTKVYPGDEIEIWESQAKWLRSIGVIDPYKKKTRSKTKAKPEAAEVEGAEDDNAVTEEDTDGDTTTEG